MCFMLWEIKLYVWMDALFVWWNCEETRHALKGRDAVYCGFCLILPACCCSSKRRFLLLLCIFPFSLVPLSGVLHDNSRKICGVSMLRPDAMRQVLSCCWKCSWRPEIQYITNSKMQTQACSSLLKNIHVEYVICVWGIHYKCSDGFFMSL